MPQIKDLTNQVFGRLTVLSLSEIKRSGKNSCTRWLCRCECSALKIVIGQHLKSGNTRSCGCLNREVAATTKKTHGERFTKLNRVWARMKERCLNPNKDNYKDYGGRGIRLCDEWMSYESFAGWAKDNGYADNLSLERIDVNGNYEPSNCCFIPILKQALNRRTTRYETVFGETKALVEWSRDPRCSVSYSILKGRLRHGWEIEKALTTPASR